VEPEGSGGCPGTPGGCHHARVEGRGSRILCRSCYESDETDQGLAGSSGVVAGERPKVFWWTPKSPGELPKRLVSVRKHSVRVRRLSVAVTRTGWGTEVRPMHSLQGVEPEGSMCEMVVADERPKVFVSSRRSSGDAI